MTMHERTHRLALLAVLATLALGGLAMAGCGGDDDDGAEGPTETQAAAGDDEAGGDGAGGSRYGGAGRASGNGGDDAGAGTVAVSLTDFAIDPANPTVEAGTVTFDVSNDGQAPHNLEVEGQGVEAALEQDLGAGESGQLTVELSQPGTYEWYCPVGSHADMGMEGELTVQ